MSNQIFKMSLGLLLVLGVTGTGYFGVIKLTENPCTTPKTWSIGSIDPRFAVSEDTVKLYSEEASATWNSAYSSNELLHYTSGKADIQIMFVYDERQRTTIQNEKLKQAIETEKDHLSTVKTTLESLKATYSSLGTVIDAKTKTYTQHLASHNSDVSYWNKRGGAPTADYQRLQVEEASLETERASLNASITTYNNLAEEIKQYGQDHNQIVDTLNQKIQTLNETVPREFEEGTYDPATHIITIYEFDDATSLKRVLTHEFGHAIGLKHVDDKNAIMYSVNQASNLNLTDADKAELNRICRPKTKEDVIEMAKTIRDDISHLVVSSWPDIAALTK